MNECTNCDKGLGERFFKAVMDKTKTFFVCSPPCGDAFMKRKGGKHIRMKEVTMVNSVMHEYGDGYEDSEMSCDIGVANLEI